MSLALAAPAGFGDPAHTLLRFTPAPRTLGRRSWLAATACAGLSLFAADAAWQAWLPLTAVTSRIVVDGGGASARTALAGLALRFIGAPGGPVQLAEGGTALLVSARDREASVAQRQVRATADAILDARLTDSVPPAPTRSPDPQPALHTERARLAAQASQLDAQGAALSANMTAVARDLAASFRSTSDHRLSKATAEKGAAALADFQIARFQLLGRYQADFPAVVALDAQIKDLRAFLAEEARRAESHPASPAEADALLLAERDRLRHEAAELDARRATLQAATAALNAQLAQHAPSPTPAALAPSIPVLLEAETIQRREPDERALPLGAIALAGLVATGLLLRRRAGDPPEWTLVAEAARPLSQLDSPHPPALAPSHPVLLRLPPEPVGYIRS